MVSFITSDFSNIYGYYVTGDERQQLRAAIACAPTLFFIYMVTLPSAPLFAPEINFLYFYIPEHFDEKNSRIEQKGVVRETLICLF